VEVKPRVGGHLLRAVEIGHARADFDGDAWDGYERTK
jgi:hypothetical protein